MAFANSRCKLIVVAEANNADELKDLMDVDIRTNGRVETLKEYCFKSLRFEYELG